MHISIHIVCVLSIVVYMKSMGSPSNGERLRAMHLKNCVCAVDGQMRALKSALSAAGIGDAGALQSAQQVFPSVCAGWQHTDWRKCV